jgi:hypothetical protein
MWSGLLNAFTALLLMLVVPVMAPLVTLDAVVPAAGVVAVVHAGLHRPPVEALVTAALVGWFSGLQVMGARGMLLLALLPVVLGTLFLRTRMPLQQPWLAMLWGMLACVIHDGFLVLQALLMQPSLTLWPTLLWGSPRTALATGVLLWLVEQSLGRIHPLLEQRQSRRLVYG